MRHVYVDETKENGFALVASVIAASDIATARGQLRGLLRAGQRRLHMHGERDSRKRLILSALQNVSCTSRVFHARHGRSERELRDACLDALIRHLADGYRYRVTLERDDHNVKQDRQTILDTARVANCLDRLEYVHLRAHEDLLLAVPDAIAWAWARGGGWRRRAQPLITDVRRV